jgi:hypothetical protein
LFQRSLVVSVSKWNALLGKEATSSKESHFDANNEEDNSANNEDGIAMADVVDATEFPGSDLVPIEDGLAGLSVCGKPLVWLMIWRSVSYLLIPRPIWKEAI